MKNVQPDKNNEQRVQPDAFLDTENLKGPKIGKRHLQVVNICFLVFASYYARNCLSVAIVAMNDRNASSNAEIPTFHWTTKNLILSSFFFGYVPIQIVVSCFLHRIRLKVFAISVVGIGAFLGLITPLIATHLGDKGVIGLRILQGMTQAFTFPFSQHTMSQWVPPSERSLLGGAVFAGRPFATVIAMLIPGFIAASNLGWPWIFYSSNILSLIWCISFAIFSHDKPATHPRITMRERRYIEKALAVQDSEKKVSIPFKAILTSIPVWAMTFASIGNVWSFWTLQTQIPMYLNYVMKFKIEKTGSIAALPYILQWSMGYGFNVISNCLTNRHVCSVTNCRKAMTAIGFFIPAIALILLQNSGPNESTKAVILINLAIGINGAAFSGYMVNPMDLSVKHSGFLMGFSNTLAQMSGFLAPLFVQFVVKHETDPNEWKYVFYTAAGSYIITAIIFIVCGSADIQPWEHDEVVKDEPEEDGLTKNTIAT